MTMKQLFKDKVYPSGKVVMTAGVADKVENDDKFAKFVMTSLGRHIRCDWGEISEDGKRAKFAALKEGGRLVSAYEGPEHTKIQIITEADRSATTILFPGED